ncbi:RNA polymerase sigma factor [Spirosoma luteolum]
MKMPRPADQDLVDRFQITQSSDSFSQLYQRYVRKVYRTCVSMTHDPVTAQDYTQDIFLRVYNKLHNFRSQSAFSTWLYSVAYHYCLDQMRRSDRLPTDSLSDEQTQEAVASQAYDDELPGAETLLQQRFAILHTLPDDEIHLLRLKYEQGVSIQALSDQYQLSVSAVKMRLKRSRDRLQQLQRNHLD